MRYGAVAQVLHWLTVVCVLGAYLTAEGGPESRVYAEDRASDLALHETFGVLVLLLLVIRLLWRAVDRVPEEPSMPLWMLLASRLTHWVLYALLLTVPTTAILGAWYENRAIIPYLVGPIGPFVPASIDFGRQLTDIHTLLGEAIIYVAGVHAAAALFHHFILRDRVLVSMLPGPEANDRG
jgi:cytochrome b561